MKKLHILVATILTIFLLCGCFDRTIKTVNTKDNDNSSSTSKTKGDGIDNMSDDYGLMLNRKNPLYYIPGEALIEDAHIVYINFDGFAYYYFEEANRRGLVPNLKKFMSEGIIFGDLRAELPCITNPCQNQILSGATSSVTKNVYRYYDKNRNIVVQQARENAADTIITKAVKDNFSIVNVRMYLGEEVLTSNNINKLYVDTDPNDEAVISHGYSGDYFARFRQLIKIVKGELFTNNGYNLRVQNLPKIMILYCDDLDALGHNESAYYGYNIAETEEERIENCLSRLQQMDLALGELVQALKERGIYDQVTFFLTTDHGMRSFGYRSKIDAMDYGRTKLGELKSFFKNLDKSWNLELVSANSTPSQSTSIVAVGANLNLQLTFKNGITDERLDELKDMLEKLYYVGKVRTRKELIEKGYWEGANVDLLISPKDRYCFSGSLLTNYYVRAQHDSLDDDATHIYGVIWGKGIKKGYVYNKEAYNFDFGTTMAASIGMILPDANGVVLDVFDVGE